MTKYTEFLPDYFKIAPVDGKYFIFILIDPLFADEVIDYFKTEKGYPTEIRTSIGERCLVVSVIPNKRDLSRMYTQYEGLSRGYMGKYKAFATAFVDAYKELPDSEK